MSQRHALIIDDNPTNGSVLANMLADENVDNTRLTNPKQLDATLKNLSSIDVVFLDLEMPGLNGYEVLERLKSDVHFQTVPIVAYTVHISEINTAHQVGFDSFLGKPLNPDKFPEQLARILRGERVWEVT